MAVVTSLHRAPDENQLNNQTSRRARANRRAPRRKYRNYRNACALNAPDRAATPLHLVHDLRSTRTKARGSLFQLDPMGYASVSLGFHNKRASHMVRFES